MNENDWDRLTKYIYGMYFATSLWTAYLYLTVYKVIMKNKFVLMLVAAFSFCALSTSAIAGSVDGKLTKIRCYEEGGKILFQSRIPNVSYSLRKGDITKVMTRHGKVRATADLERNGIIIDTDRRARVTLDRVGDGLFIRGATMTMFISERELDNIR
ncbi:MAG: hypothetical protein ACRC9N_02740 [Aeromonas sp.]